MDIQYFWITHIFYKVEFSNSSVFTHHTGKKVNTQENIVERCKTE